jgi:Flp pilus assembly protein TadG
MTLQVNVASTGADAVITLPAVSNTYYVIQRITYSYSGGVSLGNSNLLVQFGGTSVLDVDVNASQGEFNYGMSSAPNQAAVITLNGVALQVSKISISYDTYTN